MHINNAESLFLIAKKLINDVSVPHWDAALGRISDTSNPWT